MLYDEPITNHNKYHDVAALYCADDEEYLFAEQIDLHITPASVAKLLTGLLPASGNDAAYSIAAAAARAAFPNRNMTAVQAVSCFMELMNEYAAAIGMNDSRFVYPEGWDDGDQYTTARDLITLGRHILTIPELKRITGTFSRFVEFASGETITWENYNRLLNPNSKYYCPEAIGLKTGTKEAAGASLLGTVVRNKKTYITYVTGCNEMCERYLKTMEMLNSFVPAAADF
ncbi:MAG: hypothetical protein K6B74_06025 [Ruminococcus sp.]|nr:hypothetical protein [Ruminococcus sp.]